MSQMWLEILSSQNSFCNKSHWDCIENDVGIVRMYWCH